MKLKIIAALMACLLLCGCSVSASVENLLTPPRLLAEQNEIYQELIAGAGQGVKLKYPRSGDYRSAFVLYNIDDEPGEEAMVFYESKNAQSGENSLRMKFLDKTDGKWAAVYDISCAGSEIDSISFAKLGTSETTAIIVCYTVLNQTEKTFSVLSYDGKTPSELLSSGYSCLEVVDLNKDGFDELVTVTISKANMLATAAMYTDGENGFEKLSETPLYGGVTDYLRVTKGQLDEDTPALFLDYSNGAQQAGTNVLYCYGNRLFCPDSIGQNPAAGLISRQLNDYMAQIYCFDIDGDGLVEIPSTTPLPGYETLTKPEQLCAVQWYTVQDDNFILESYSYFSGKFRFALLFPSRWRGVVTAVADFPNNEIIFISYNEETGLAVTEETELMRIRAVPKDDPEALEAAKSFKLLGESDETVFYCIETAGYKTGKLALTESELKASFIIV
ncbi:MAG: hypothetical protein K2N38_02485 [Oscillospiraceae bacterium]|nr:hypothetical protein [Oscillospiraceae bacterium]